MSEKNKIKGKYKHLKKVIKVLLHFCDGCPPSPPEDPKALSGWHRNPSAMAEKASKELPEDFQMPHVTPAHLMTSAIVKEWEDPRNSNSKKFPSDTPPAVLSHFGQEQ